MNEEHRYLLRMLAIALLMTAIVVGILEYLRSDAPEPEPAATRAVPSGYVPVRLLSPGETP